MKLILYVKIFKKFLLDIFEIAMEIMPSKFRSPPPKPPRRRHSDQLAISPSGTYPSSRKKYHDESRQGTKGSQLKVGNNPGCGSLPANWITDFSPDNKVENLILNKSAPSNSAHLKNAYINFEMPISSVLDKDSNGLTDILMETDYKQNMQCEWTRKKELPYFEQVLKNSVLSSHCSKSFLGCCNDAEIDNYIFDITTSNSLESKSSSREHHKRHHSDPVLSYKDKSNSKNDLQKYVPKSHSILENFSFDNQRLCTSLNASFKLKETKNLHEEIKNLKEINNKLWQHLCSTQACLENMKGNLEENTSSVSISDLLSSLYCSQKARECAMEDRMKIILEERNTAVQELENMVQIIARNFKDEIIEKEEKCSDEEIKNLLKEIEMTYNPSRLLQQQRLLLTYLYQSKELKQDHIMHELKLAISEKDHLKEKGGCIVKYLEEELKSMKICNELWNADNKHWENNLLNILCQVIQQRDVAVSKTNNIQTLELTGSRSAKGNVEFMNQLMDSFGSLQKHNEDGLKKNFQTSYHDTQKHDEVSIESTSDDIGLLKDEILVLNRALKMEIEKRENAEEKCLRLERLVNVLQRKVNGQNVGISV
ncbi:uncharacterized protein CEXT_810131 [Caerostris extrusa]|uniref:Uncharacterized protein n=1 Tax=Caerostris extrusa TaxID=172846 RepID=A0AAV4W3S3_CAEEX|nr:uncharacterized protein CEXT_810131 [Caerostris extrusa]